jgi:hypothetical protein
MALIVSTLSPGAGGRRRLPAVVALGLAVLVLAAGGVRLIGWWREAAAVPDHAAPFSATFAMRFAGATTLAQRVRPRLDGFTAADLLVVAEAPGLPGSVELRVEEWPSRRLVRTSRLPAASVPAPASPWEARPGQPGERWLSFGFEPIGGSAGRDYLLVLSYPDGRDAAGARLIALAHFPSLYAPGELLVNGAPQDGNLLFRLAARGTHGAALGLAAGNLARAQAIVAGTLVAPGVLAAASAVLAVGLAVAIVRAWPEPAGEPAGEPGGSKR